MAFFTPDQIAALSAGVVRADLLVRMQFRDSVAYLWNGNTDLVAGGQTWKPMYGAGGIDGISFTGDTQSEAVTFRLSGVNTQMLAAALEETPQVTQQLVSVFLQLFDDEWQPIGSPIGIWWGFMQPPKVSRTPIEGVEGGIQVITVSAENAFFNRARPPHGRGTDADQRRRSPGDRFFRDVSKLKFKSFNYPLFR